MATRPRNMEKFAAGALCTMDVWFREFIGGSLTDPDIPPTFRVYDPTNVLITEGVAQKVSIGYFQAVFQSTLSWAVSDSYRIEWFATIKGSTISDEEFFSILPAGDMSFGGVVNMTDDWLEQVKKVLSFPVITDDILLTDLQIKNYCVREALDAYFMKFPMEQREQYAIEETLTLDFPNSDVFGVMDIRVVDKMLAGGSPMGSSFWEIYKYNKIFGYMSGVPKLYQTGYNFNQMRQQLFMQRQVIQTLTNDNTFKYHVDYVSRKVEAYSSCSAKLAITWALRSLNFDAVKFQHKWDVIHLAQAHYLYHMADTTGIMQDNSLEQSTNSSDLKARADDLVEKVMEKWIAIPDVILIRTA